jgi:hypothetical protein
MTYTEKLAKLLAEQQDIVISDYDVLDDLEEEIIEAETKALGKELAWADLVENYYNN